MKEGSNVITFSVELQVPDGCTVSHDEISAQFKQVMYDFMVADENAGDEIDITVALRRID